MNSFLFLFLSVAVFVFVVWKYYYVIQIHLNAEALALDKTPTSYPISNHNEYLTKISTGKELMKHSTVVICALLRDVEETVDDIERKVEYLGDKFQDYRVLVVENDSSDDTREEFLEWAKRNDKVIVLGCGVNKKECKLSLARTQGHGADKKRIDKMTYLRNIYLDYAREHFSNFDFMIVWDLDIIGSVYLDGIQNSFGHFAEDFDNRIDAVCAYGIYRWFGFATVYYDTFAHLDPYDHFDIKEKKNHDINKGIGIKGLRGDPLRKVRSCFGGFTIYRMKSLVDSAAAYTYTDEDKLLCEHVTLCDSLKGVYMNPSMIYRIIRND